MEGAWKKYVRAFKNDLDAWAVWQPGTPVELYDYGVVSIVPSCSPAGLTLCAAKRRKFAASAICLPREAACGA